MTFADFICFAGGWSLAVHRSMLFVEQDSGQRWYAVYCGHDQDNLHLDRGGGEMWYPLPSLKKIEVVPLPNIVSRLNKALGLELVPE